MPAAVTDADLFAELVTLTGIGPSEWRDLLSLPEDDLRATVQGYRDMDWTQRPDTLGQVLGVLNALAGVAGAVSGISGAVTAVAALRSL
jgi:hypothetical protein